MLETGAFFEVADSDFDDGVSTMVDVEEAGVAVMVGDEGATSWGQIFDDPMVAAAMLDRLLHHSVVFSIEGESYRMRSHRAPSETLRREVRQPEIR